MYIAEGLAEIHRRTHESLNKLLEHGCQFDEEDLVRQFPGFGYETLRMQFHHAIGGEQYWIGVLLGRMDVDDDDSKYPTIDKLQEYRVAVYSTTNEYLRNASAEELNTPRLMVTWKNNERMLIPAHVIMRTQTHIFHHQGQIVAMFRLLGKQIGPGIDYTIV
jgi:uncharacterized damage-inducible protein DinB